MWPSGFQEKSRTPSAVLSSPDSVTLGLELIIMSSGSTSKDLNTARDNKSRPLYSSLDPSDRPQRTDNRQALAESNLHSQRVSAPPGYAGDSVRPAPNPYYDDDILSRGCDSTQFDMSQNLSSRLLSPWSEESAELPEFWLPNTYYLHIPTFKQSYFQKFVVTTLFYIFYAFPKDMLQSLAANELYKRGWKFDLDTKRWHTTNEEGTWKTFDLESWSEKTVQSPTSLLRHEEFSARPRG